MKYISLLLQVQRNVMNISKFSSQTRCNEETPVLEFHTSLMKTLKNRHT